MDKQFNPAIVHNSQLNKAKWRAGFVADKIRSGEWSATHAYDDVMHHRVTKPAMVGVICGCIVGALVESGHADKAEQFLVGMAKHSDNRGE